MNRQWKGPRGPVGFLHNERRAAAQKCKDLYESGYTIIECAKELGCGEATVRGLLDWMGVARRRTGPRPKKGATT